MPRTNDEILELIRLTDISASDSGMAIRNTWCIGRINSISMQQNNISIEIGYDHSSAQCFSFRPDRIKEFQKFIGVSTNDCKGRHILVHLTDNVNPIIDKIRRFRCDSKWDEIKEFIV